MDHKIALQTYIDATNTHDFTNVKNVLHEDAVYWFTDKTCTSLNEIQAAFENAWDVIKDEVYSATDVQWLTVDENSATCIYTFHYEGYIDEEFISGSGRATNVFTKDGNREWKLIHEHLSSV
ncbi:nuclear transport factor 2 family protein [Alkalihalobacillus sp. AL-G]|uniref:YybH family protein n=1 Tax=Alkalihalobacillus sp. AL-G TaxID=2926399 RepID=UPI00272D0D69|nr:nuclear transport factor 2 family protein [Alkalihalobacillus sp. AL-G]WLD94425.1 nuclear transport factor 2 family protein [Alkalihalobacillus sp. AL-G]